MLQNFVLFQNEAVNNVASNFRGPRMKKLKASLHTDLVINRIYCLTILAPAIHPFCSPSLSMYVSVCVCVHVLIVASKGRKVILKC